MFWFFVDFQLDLDDGKCEESPSTTTNALHMATSTNQLQFKLEVAKQLIGGYSGRKRYAGKRRKATLFDNAIFLPNLPDHHVVKLEGCKGACMLLLSAQLQKPNWMAVITVAFTFAGVVAFLSTTQNLSA